MAEGGRRAAPYLLRQGRWKEASTLLDQMLLRDSSPASLAFALPLLRRIVEATAGTGRGWSSRQPGRDADAGRTHHRGGADDARRDRARAAQSNYRVASIVAGDLCNLLRRSGRLEEALRVAEEKAGYTRQAGLGPWTQLVDEAQRLQVLAAMGVTRSMRPR